MTPVPFNLVLWDAQQCAEYLGVKHRTFLKTTQFKPGFPERCPQNGMKPVWLASEVIEWRTGRKVAA